MKASILTQFVGEINRAVEEGINSITECVVNKNSEVGEGGEYAQSIKSVQEQVNKILVQNEKLKEENAKLINRIDDLEQYGRRLSLRIYNVPMQGKENMRDKVFKIISDANIDIPSFAIDRAHRIGKIKRSETGETSQAVIVRFISFHFRTLVYRAREKMVGYKFYLDLTKTRLSILQNAKELVKNVSQIIGFVYADINCMLRAFANGKHLLFTNIDDLQNIIQELSP